MLAAMADVRAFTLCSRPNANAKTASAARAPPAEGR
jgi:hypothetical protein